MKPTIIPSFLPRINPKAEVTIIKRFGVMEANDKLGNTVHSNIKHAIIIQIVIILRFNLIPPITSLSLL